MAVPVSAMVHRGIAAGAAALVALMAVGVPATAAAEPVRVAQVEVDPRLVGTWTLQTMNTAGGTVRSIWEIDRDGGYRFRAEGAGAPPAHAGRGVFAQGQWSLRASEGQPGWTDAGSYQVVGGDHVFFVGRLGPGTWQRMAGVPAAATTPWPADLGSIVLRANALARARLADAMLYELDVQRRPPGQPPGSPEHDYRLSFWSAADQSILTVMPGNAAGEVWPGGRQDLSDRPALPDRVLGFAEAERRAQILGMRGRAERASLSARRGGAWPTWTIWPVSASRAFEINASAGVPPLQATPEELGAALAETTGHLARLAAALGTPGRAYAPKPDHADDLAAGMVARAGLTFERIGTSAEAGILVYRDRAAAEAHHRTFMGRGGGRFTFVLPRRWTDAGIGALEARCLVGFTANELLFARCAWLHPTLPAIATGYVRLPPRPTVTNHEMDPILDQAAFPLTMAAAFFLTDVLQAR
ncbi:MAG: hypothetical protein AB7O45_09680 [Alphaproteobacteria bacterium]